MHVKSVNYLSDSAQALFCLSLKETGFAVLTHHPIDGKLIENALEQWKSFFASEDKFNYLYQKPSQAGYFPFKAENAKDRATSDLKEFFHFYPDGVVPAETKEVSEGMFIALKKLSSELLSWVEKSLPTDLAAHLSMPLKNMIDDSPNTLLRIIHYPPLSGDHEEGAVRAAPHEDINLITLLPAASAPGLEVRDLKGNWHSVDCDPGSIVVNVGDMLQMCTQNYYTSTTHRVTNPNRQEDNTSRFSMPFFLHPNSKVRLSEKYIASDYLHDRLRAIGIY